MYINTWIWNLSVFSNLIFYVHVHVLTSYTRLLSDTWWNKVLYCKYCIGPDYMGRSGSVGRFAERSRHGVVKNPKIDCAITWKRASPESGDSGWPGSPVCSCNRLQRTSPSLRWRAGRRSQWTTEMVGAWWLAWKTMHWWENTTVVSLPKSTFSQPFKEKCISEVERIVTIFIFQFE